MKLTIKKIFKLFVLTWMVTTVFGCADVTTDVSTNTTHSTDETTTVTTNTITETQVNGIYRLTYRSVSDIDMTNQSVYEVLQLDDSGQATIRSLDMYGLHEETGTYIRINNTVNITLGLRTYEYQYDDSSSTLVFEGQVNRRNVTIHYQLDNQFDAGDSTGDVSFYDELFGEPSSEKFYNYAPTVIMEGNDTMHIWYCSNKDSGDITDYIAYRKGSLMSDGLWHFTDKQLVLGPTEGTWDERHTCDPDVVKGEFSYQEESYTYLMAYLGCVTSDNSRNEVGIAVAKKPEGPWIKVNDINPIANYYTSDEYSEEWAWGYGQPSLVSVDQSGQVLLFYTKGISTGTSTYVERWDLSDLDNPEKLNETMINNTGVVNASGMSDVINNASFAYDETFHRLYVVKEDFPYPEDSISWITGANTVLFVQLNDSDEYVGETLFTSNSYRWQVIQSITYNRTGFFRNHNMCIVTDAYGRIMSPFELPIIYTMSLTDSDENINSEISNIWRYLGTYRLHGLKIDIN